MPRVLAHNEAESLTAAFAEFQRARTDLPPTAGAAIGRLLEVLETSPDAVIFPSDQSLSTQQAAVLLGISRMTVVRLIDRGELAADTASVHRRIPVSELARYQRETKARRSHALSELAGDITDQTPPDEVITTR